MTAAAAAEPVAAALGLPRQAVARTLELLDAGNTIPFIARYRKEATGGLDEVAIGHVAERVAAWRALEERRADVRRLVEEAGALTPELDAAIAAAPSLATLDDLYLPYRPKRRTRATIARERGLEPLALMILAQERLAQSRHELARPFVDPERGVQAVEEALAGARDVVAETINEHAAVRAALRALFACSGIITTTSPDAATKDPTRTYATYYSFTARVSAVAPHQTLALNRGEKAGVLRVAVEAPDGEALAVVAQHFAPRALSPLADDLRNAAVDAYRRLIAPSLERETRTTLTEAAEEHAIGVFARNLRALLLQPPLRGRTVLGIDPGFRTGCKVAVVDPTGKPLAVDTIYPHPPQNKAEEALATLHTLVAAHGVSVIAIGNGTASRETEHLVARLIDRLHGKAANLAYAIVSEAGASVYSASPVARAEFPDLDVTARGTISIARRLQDPLAELVKVPPQSIGVGLYQHDVDAKRLAAALARVVESAVNFAGVDANTASAALLSHVAGMTRRVAENMVAYRNANGPFATRRDFLKVPGLGPATFTQAAGFLKVPGGANPLDDTFIHPESYGATERLIALMPGGTGGRLSDRAARFRAAILADDDLRRDVAAQVGLGEPTLLDVLENLAKPGLDPRAELPPPLLRRDVLTLDDLREGMVLKGTVRNVVDFGAFVDIGLKNDGLVHRSELGPRFVRDPLAVVSVGDIVSVRVLSVDRERGRIALSMRDV
ncbi:MAG TPA: Tex family protein, partial [Chloroflexota bacterium]|nr:Tex family protein [Chloroflexota bacterium]